MSAGPQAAPEALGALVACRRTVIGSAHYAAPLPRTAPGACPTSWRRSGDGGCLHDLIGRGALGDDLSGALR